MISLSSISGGKDRRYRLLESLSIVATHRGIPISIGVSEGRRRGRKSNKCCPDALSEYTARESDALAEW